MGFNLTLMSLALVILNGYSVQMLILMGRNLTSTYQINRPNSRNVSSIYLSKNNIEILELGNLYLFTSLTGLNFDMNKIRCIKNGTFNQMNRLTF